MYPVVEIRQPNQTTLFVSVREPIEVGRECNGILLADPQVSRRHLLLEPDRGRVIVSDLGSTNGSTIDGTPLLSPTVLIGGRQVKCGETTITLDTPADQTVRAGAGAGPGRATLAAGGDDQVDPSTTIVSGGSPASPDGAPGAGGNAAPGAVSSVGSAAPASFAPQRPVTTDDDLHRTSIDLVAASAQSDGLDVRSLPVDQGTVTIVFSDIESSTERNVALGDQVWFEVLGVHNRIVSDRVNQFGGTIIKNQGDGFMLSFPGARKALDCMVNVQRDLAAHSNSHPERSVRIRIGMHTGEVLTDSDGDLFGQHVVVAARVANLATGGEILVSSLTKEIVASRGDVEFDAPRQVMLKGIGDATVYPIVWH